MPGVSSAPPRRPPVLGVLGQVRDTLRQISAEARIAREQIARSVQASSESASEHSASIQQVAQQVEGVAAAVGAHSTGVRIQIKQIVDDALSAADIVKKLAEILSDFNSGRISVEELKRRLAEIGYTFGVIGDPGLPFESLLGGSLLGAFDDGSL